MYQKIRKYKHKRETVEQLLRLPQIKTVHEHQLLCIQNTQTAENVAQNEKLTRNKNEKLTTANTTNTEINEPKKHKLTYKVVQHCGHGWNV